MDLKRSRKNDVVFTMLDYAFAFVLKSSIVSEAVNLHQIVLNMTNVLGSSIFPSPLSLHHKWQL